MCKNTARSYGELCKKKKIEENATNNNITESNNTKRGCHTYYSRFTGRRTTSDRTNFYECGYSFTKHFRAEPDTISDGDMDNDQFKSSE